MLQNKYQKIVGSTTTTVGNVAHRNQLLRRGGYVFTCVGVFVCLTVSRITKTRQRIFMNVGM